MSTEQHRVAVVLLLERKLHVTEELKDRGACG